MKPDVLRLLSLVLLAPALVLVVTALSVAQTTDANQPRLESTEQIEDAREAVEAASNTVKELQASDEVVRFDEASLVDIQLQLDDIIDAMETIRQDLQPRLDAITTREEALGEPPGENDPPEPDGLVAERQSLANEKALINTDIGAAAAVSRDAEDLARSVSDYRSTLFREALLGRADISWQSWNEARAEIVPELQQIGTRVSGWASFTWRYKRGALVAAVALTLALGLLFAYGERHLASRVLRHDPADENPSAFERHTLAFWSTLLPVVALGVFVSLAAFFFNSFNLLRGDISAMLAPMVYFVLMVFFVSRLATAVLSPGQPQWRLVPVSNRGAQLLWWLVFAMVFVNAGDYLAASISDVLETPFVLIVVQSFLATVIIGFILIVTSFVRPLVSEDGGRKAWPATIRILLQVLGLALIVLSLAGYVGLARFVATQIVLIGSLLVTIYIGFLAARAVSEPEPFAGSALGQFLADRLGFSRMVVEQCGLFSGLLLYLAILGLGIPVVFLAWGFHPEDIQNWVQERLSSITIGDVTISLTGILLGILLFAAGYFITRWFQRWIDENVMQRGRLEPGLRNSIRTAIGYAGVALAAVIGLSVAGLNLSNLAIVAGALSVGIGFGLQNIVNNFVSGLILLAERPFKVGDWVVTSSTQGFVKHISVRATEIETFQRQSVMVPNSELINSPVGNWTHRNRQGRVDIAIGVSYDSDPRRVIALLEEIGLSNDLVLRDPSPGIIFMGFGDSSLDFELRVYLQDVLSSLSVGTDLRLKIFERFKQEGIEIPFPQRDLHIKLPSDSDESVAETLDGLKLSTPRTPKPKRYVAPDSD